MKPIFKLIYVFLLVCTGASAYADLSAQQWVDIDIQTRQLTVDGMAQRAALLARGASLPEQMDADSVVQAKVAEVYQRNNTSPVAFLRWAAANRNAIDEWLMLHPEKSAELADIKQRFDQVGQEIRSRTGAP